MVALEKRPFRCHKFSKGPPISWQRPNAISATLRLSGSRPSWSDASVVIGPSKGLRFVTGDVAGGGRDTAEWHWPFGKSGSVRGDRTRAGVSAGADAMGASRLLPGLESSEVIKVPFAQMDPGQPGIDLLNAVKEDVRDHHQTYASRIDTLLVVHTLLLTFALATLQYSDQFVPVSGCVECEENEHPWLVSLSN
eukprot:s459_g15.t1